MKTSLPNIYNNNGNHLPDHSKHNYRNNNPQPTMISGLNNEQLPVTETLDSTTKPFPNRSNMNKKYHHDIRTSHTYRNNIPQTITALNLNNAQYSTTEIAQQTKPLSQKNLPAFIFTINSSPEHLNPNWKSGQKYNPPQVYEPVSTLPSQAEQEKAARSQLFKPKHQGGDNNENDCDDSPNPMQGTITLDHLSLGKHGPDYKSVQNSPNYQKSEETPEHVNEQAIRTANNDENTKEIGPLDSNNKNNENYQGNPSLPRGKQGPTIGQMNPIALFKVPFKKEFTNNQHQKDVQQRKYKPMILSYKHNVPKKKNNDKQRHERSSEEFSGTSEKPLENSESIEDKRAEYAALERAAELEAEK
ncbi:chitin-binding type-2 domain-containing protein [Caerostris extrusa]|uniref:Chitin-binding type-2 domain-containing protein n=1 Tax=Caerostris extrusa TaxID=172846 RepID=A0AAV4UYT6_CAEEX|nr:chitin-binding type-2 domain-containing protein [Caerostris extrusa]